MRMGVIEEMRRMIKVGGRDGVQSKIRSWRRYSWGERNQWGNWSDVPSEKCG